MLNAARITVGRMIRGIIPWYYKLMGVTIHGTVFISHHASIDTTYRGSVTIHDGCYITRDAKLIAHDHSIYRLRRFEEDNGRGRIVLRENVFVGSGAIILRNVTVGENSIIAAGAVVTKDVPKNVIVGGNPARVIRQFEPIEGRQSQ